MVFTITDVIHKIGLWRTVGDGDKAIPTWVSVVQQSQIAEAHWRLLARKVVLNMLLIS